jgi:hypothetical protein
LNPNRRLIVLLLIFANTLAVFLIFNDKLNDWIATPLLNLFVSAWRMLLSPQQIVYWAILILVVLAIALRSIFSGRREEPSGQSGKLQEYSGAWVRPWVLTIEHARGKVFKRSAVVGFRKIAAAVIAHRETLPTETIENNLAARRQVLPGRAGEYLIALEEAAAAQEVARPSLLIRIINQLRRRFKLSNSARSSHRDERIKLDQEGLNDFIHYLERQMEMHHDNDH